MPGSTPAEHEQRASECAAVKPHRGRRRDRCLGEKQLLVRGCFLSVRGDIMSTSSVMAFLGFNAPKEHVTRAVERTADQPEPTEVTVVHRNIASQLRVRLPCSEAEREMRKHPRIRQISVHVDELRVCQSNPQPSTTAQV